jgi:uncharacterized membrane protein YgaE (UPF0421/DUF939 family)
LFLGRYVLKVRPSPFINGLQLALRAGVAAGTALAIAMALGLRPAIFAFISAVIVTDLDPAQSRKLGLRRIAATVVGALCGVVFTLWLPSNPWTIGLAVLVAMLICQNVGAADGSRVAAFTCGIIILMPGDGPWLNAFERFVETILGVAVAWSISYVPKLIRIEEPGDQSV